MLSSKLFSGSIISKCGKSGRLVELTKEHIRIKEGGMGILKFVKNIFNRERLGSNVKTTEK